MFSASTATACGSLKYQGCSRAGHRRSNSKSTVPGIEVVDVEELVTTVDVEAEIDVVDADDVVLVSAVELVEEAAVREANFRY